MPPNIEWVQATRQLVPIKCLGAYLECVTFYTVFPSISQHLYQHFGCASADAFTTHIYSLHNKWAVSPHHVSVYRVGGWSGTGKGKGKGKGVQEPHTSYCSRYVLSLLPTGEQQPRAPLWPPADDPLSLTYIVCPPVCTLPIHHHMARAPTGRVGIAGNRGQGVLQIQFQHSPLLCEQLNYTTVVTSQACSCTLEYTVCASNGF